MAKAKAKSKPPKVTTALIDVLVFAFDTGETTCVDAYDYVDPKTGALDLEGAEHEAIDRLFEEYNGPIDIYRITRTVERPVRLDPVPIPMVERDGPLVTPPPKAQAGRRGAR